MPEVAKRMLWTLFPILHAYLCKLIRSLSIDKLIRKLIRNLSIISSLLHWSVSEKPYIFFCFFIQGIFIGVYKYKENLPEITASMSAKAVLIYIWAWAKVSQAHQPLVQCFLSKLRVIWIPMWAQVTAMQGKKWVGILQPSKNDLKSNTSVSKIPLQKLWPSVTFCLKSSASLNRSHMLLLALNSISQLSL